MAPGRVLFNVAMRNLRDNHANMNTADRCRVYFRRQFSALAEEHAYDIMTFTRLFNNKFTLFWVQYGYHDIPYAGAYNIARDEFRNAFLPLLRSFNAQRALSIGGPADITNIMYNRLIGPERARLLSFLRR